MSTVFVVLITLPCFASSGCCSPYSHQNPGNQADDQLSLDHDVVLNRITDEDVVEYVEQLIKRKDLISARAANDMAIHLFPELWEFRTLREIIDDLEVLNEAKFIVP